MDTNAPWRALEGPETGAAPRPPEKPKPAGFLVALAVAIALKVKGRPVKLRLTREEEFYTAFVRQFGASPVEGL